MADPEVGQVDFKWKVTTAATLCFLHFIYYMDRFGIAGQSLKPQKLSKQYSVKTR